MREEAKTARQDKDLVIAQAAMEISQVQAKLELVDKFSKKLRKNRKALMDKHGCREVKFQVYIKDGKAALKATPVKG